MKITVTEHNEIEIQGINGNLSIDNAIKLFDDLSAAIYKAKQRIKCCDSCMCFHSCTRRKAKPISNMSTLHTCDEWDKALSF